MLKIVTHPLYLKCIKVFESCDTKEQMKIALIYTNLAKKHIKREITIGDASPWNFYEIEKWFDQIVEKYDRLFTDE